MSSSEIRKKLRRGSLFKIAVAAILLIEVNAIKCSIPPDFDENRYTDYENILSSKVTEAVVTDLIQDGRCRRVLNR